MANFTMVKICVLGEVLVGKTSVSIRYVEDTFQADVKPTVGASYLSRYCSAPNGTLYKFQVWDTAGAERFKSLVPLYYRGASVIIIVYDITNADSFHLGVRNWVKELKGKAPDDALIVLLGNKFDLAALDREVAEKEGQKYAKSIDALFFETSAKTGYNVTKVFHEIANKLEKRQKPTEGVVSQLPGQENDWKRRDTVKFRSDESKPPEKRKRSRICCSS